MSKRKQRSNTGLVLAHVSSPTREYIYSGSALVATHAGETLTFHHADHLSVRAISNTSGASVNDRGHFPFGELWYETGTSEKWIFTSYERDAESGNDYAIARYHVNRLGRFSAPDPIAGRIVDPQTLNRYIYARNNPVNLVDPLGLDFIAVENTNMGVARWGFNQFDAMKHAMNQWWADYDASQGITNDYNCMASMGVGCDGLWYDFQTGQWGFDLSAVKNWGMDPDEDDAKKPENKPLNNQNEPTDKDGKPCYRKIVDRVNAKYGTNFTEKDIRTDEKTGNYASMLQGTANITLNATPQQLTSIQTGRFGGGLSGAGSTLHVANVNTGEGAFRAHLDAGNPSRFPFVFGGLRHLFRDVVTNSAGPCP